MRIYDENLQQRALKTEYINVLQQLNLYVKKDHYNKFSQTVAESFTETSNLINELEERMKQQDIIVFDTIDHKIKEAQKRIDKRMNQKLENLPGYHEETIGEKLGV